MIFVSVVYVIGISQGVVIVNGDVFKISGEGRFKFFPRIFDSKCVLFV